MRRILLTLGAVGGAAWLARARWHRHAIHWSPSQARLVRGPLSARVLGERGMPIVLLHGLTASSRIWGGAFDRLADQHRLLAPDLLGFGASPRPPGGYGPDEHVTALIACLDELGVREPAIIVGHSMGSLVGIHLGATHPERVAALVALAPPLYRNESEARQRIGGMGYMARAFTLDTELAHRTCEWVCEHRTLASRVAEIARPDLPAPIARDGVQHSWPSYSQSLERVLLGATIRAELPAVQAPVLVVVGARDRIAPPELVEDLVSPGRVSIEVWARSAHNLPLTDPTRCVDAIAHVAEAAGALSG